MKPAVLCFICGCSKRSSFALKIQQLGPYLFMISAQNRDSSDSDSALKIQQLGLYLFMISAQNRDSSDFMLAFSLQHHIPHYEAVSRFKKIRGLMATLLTYVIL